MVRQAGARVGVACAAALALTACVTGTDPKSSGAARLAPAASPVSVARDVEAPEVFNLTGQGLWDGRPSLGGVWVAHSSVTDPERVIIRNAGNGKSVVGALFRRERELPGPGLQVSSDAAEALGLIAGQPGEVSIVALRREEAPVPVDAVIGAAESEPALAAEDTADLAGSAVGEASAAAAESAAEPAAEADDAGGPDAGARPDPLASDAAEPKPARGLFGFLKKKPKAPAPGAEAVAAGAGAAAIEQSTLDPVAASAAAAIERAEAAAAPVAASAAVATAATTPEALKRSYIQIGIFSVEANADRAAGQMQAAGMAATVRADQSNGKTYWRVIVGPAASAAERDALVARVKGIGYPDAYAVAN